MLSEIMPQLGSQCSIEMLDDGGLDVLNFHGKVIKVVSFQPLLKFMIEEFRSLVHLLLFSVGSVG